METDEKKLIERASGGDPSAFNALMGAHENHMYAVALRMCHNREDAQDCLQEAMLRVFRAIWRLQGAILRFPPGLYRITMNTCLDELAQAQKEPPEYLAGQSGGSWAGRRRTSGAAP